jgi:hypothetical protein
MWSAGTVGTTPSFIVIQLNDCSWCTDVWYSLPLRTSLWSAGSAAALTDDTPTDRERGGYTIIPLSMRLYMTYDHAEKNSVNILYPPHGTDSTATLKKFLSHSDPLGIKDDPFGVHLLYLWRAAIDWRKVLQDITNELMYHVMILALVSSITFILISYRNWKI